MAFIQVSNADRPNRARTLLAAAERAGVDPTQVRTVDGGYEVPQEVLDAEDTDADPGEVELNDGQPVQGAAAGETATPEIAGQTSEPDRTEEATPPRRARRSSKDND